MMYQTVITRYRFCSGEIANLHDREVEKLISCGWKPLGGVSYSESNGYAVLVQAMVKG